RRQACRGSMREFTIDSTWRQDSRWAAGLPPSRLRRTSTRSPRAPSNWSTQRRGFSRSSRRGVGSNRVRAAGDHGVSVFILHDRRPDVLHGDTGHSGRATPLRPIGCSMLRRLITCPRRRSSTTGRMEMKSIKAGMLGLAALVWVDCSGRSDGPTSPSYSVAGLGQAGASAVGGARTGFGFNGRVSGFPTGAVFLTGGGSFNAASASNVVPSETDVKSGGGFRCEATVAQGPLNGCAAGEGVRWDTVQLLASTRFRCTGTDAAKQIATGAGTVVLLADF